MNKIFIALTLAAAWLIAVPVAAQEGSPSAVAEVRMVNFAKAQDAFKAKNGRYGSLQELATAGHLKVEDYPPRAKNEGDYWYSPFAVEDTYCVQAGPREGVKGDYYSLQNGDLRYDESQIARCGEGKKRSSQ
jgi:uncharacterized low-complexity protein